MYAGKNYRRESQTWRAALQVARDNEAGATSSLGYARFVCHACGRRFNERTGMLFNDLQ